MTDERASLLTLIASGFVILLPVLLLGLIIAKLYEILDGWLHPLLVAMPGIVFKKGSIRFLVVISAIVVLFLAVGALARTRLGQAAGRRVEELLLNRIPFYRALRVLVTGLGGQQDAESMRPVVVTVDVPGLDQLGFVMETHADGSCTVFLPSSPNPGSGTIVIVCRERLRDLDVPVRSVLGCLGRLGHGTGRLLERADQGLRDSQGIQEGL
ncbi:MAG: DUF502 domain-containing protein [Syntrophotaleaceae bacterium]